MRTDSAPERGTIPHLSADLARAHALRRVRRQETGEKSLVLHASYLTTRATHSPMQRLRRESRWWSCQ